MSRRYKTALLMARRKTAALVKLSYIWIAVDAQEARHTLESRDCG